MSSFFVSSYLALWLVVLLLSVAILAMTRQIALLHSRILPAGARASKAGPVIGKKVEPFEGEDIYGNLVQVPASPEKQTLVLFVSEGCAVCEKIAPAIVSLARHEKKIVDVILATFNGTESSNRLYAKKAGLSHLPFLLSKDFASSMAVFSAPYALLIDANGILRSKGLVNSREHLDSLLNVVDSGFATREEYFRRGYVQPVEGGDLLETNAVNGNGSRG